MKRFLVCILNLCILLTSTSLFSQVIPDRPNGDYLVTKEGDTIRVKNAEIRNKVIVYNDLADSYPFTHRKKKEEFSVIDVFDPAVVELPKTEGRVQYQEVIEISGSTKKELYQRARLWFADTYKNSEKVLELDNFESGALVGTGWAELVYGIRFFITTKVELKEGKYRYTLNGMEIKIPATSVSARYENTLATYWAAKKNRTIRQSILVHLQGHIDSLKKAMESSKSDDW